MAGRCKETHDEAGGFASSARVMLPEGRTCYWGQAGATGK